MSDEHYEVGYGKPPRNTQFKKGQSGNPKGRPKGTRNFKTDLEEELAELVQVTEGGTVHQISKQRAVQKRTVERALSGDMRAADLVVKWCAQYLGMEEEIPASKTLHTDDQAILDHYLEQQQAAKSDPENEP